LTLPVTWEEFQVMFNGSPIKAVSVPLGLLTVMVPAEMVKFAVTVLSLSMVTVVDAELGLATLPVQPANCQPEARVAVTVTMVPELYVPPGGSRLMLPLPDGLTLVERVYCSGAKVAVTVLLPSTAMVAGLALPVRSPLQPLNDELGSAVAVNCTRVPDG